MVKECQVWSMQMVELARREHDGTFWIGRDVLSHNWHGYYTGVCSFPNPSDCSYVTKAFYWVELHFRKIFFGLE